ncbi:DNA polymerase [Desulfacinum hydrothermale DSM 13146]|uniref:Type-4 uracil-DNA glycosylase n=1 Tax=Desulfacinum hydrothermale DSM 13146 TaxID=1121390 RepID=A0A1W1X0U1_9BACT|nr:uracil-DNA glycosylase [Desulfacinum hydrothermale]SMC17579.1 DNA polymerase [Desulfacinum hydrothermale DSM 13146]
MNESEIRRMAESVLGTVASLRRAGLKEILRHDPKPASPVGEESGEPEIPTEPPPRAAEPALAEKDAPSESANEKAQRLLALREELGECTRCQLHGTRTHLVFGEGNPAARLVFVGEGPGADEDRLGRPFVGRAGKLLDKMIQAIGLRREQVYICNVVKCRPPGNRTPIPEEIEPCSPFLYKQLEVVQPKVICTLGACATQTILQTTKPISELRSGVRLWRGIPVVPTYHPAYLLRNPAKKANVWEDLLRVLQILED